jgi:pSer/pThr/pTyr-binding forkhead associated (FHA) protein
MNLEGIEARLKSLIEDRLAGVLAGRNAEELIVKKLAAAIRDGTVTAPDGTRFAPNVYTLVVSPATVRQWQEPGLLGTLTEIIKTTAKDAGLKFEFPPVITITTDANLPANLISLLAAHQNSNIMEDTQNTPPVSEDKIIEDNTIPENAFLIVEGVKVFALGAPVINIGRRLDNSLVIDDPRVSRNHAQLRAIKGRYVIFDLNSTGGTFINGRRASQGVLYPGDVISLAGVMLIFGQDNPPPRTDMATASPFFDSSDSDRPTAIIITTPPTKRKKKE